MRCIADASSRPATGPLVSEPPAVTLRGFRPTDLTQIIPIVEEALWERYDPSLYSSLSLEWPEGFLVAADVRDLPVGFLLGVSQVTREGRVLMFAVERDHRAQGVGSALMEEFLTRCRARGFQRATLEVRVSNATAIRFYARYGYSVVDLLRGYYSDGENGYQMARSL